MERERTIDRELCALCVCVCLRRVCNTREKERKFAFSKANPAQHVRGSSTSLSTLNGKKTDFQSRFRFPRFSLYSSLYAVFQKEISGERKSNIFSLSVFQISKSFESFDFRYSLQKIHDFRVFKPFRFPIFLTKKLPIFKPFRFSLFKLL